MDPFFPVSSSPGNCCHAPHGPREFGFCQGRIITCEITASSPTEPTPSEHVEYNPTF
jgi:hypothetical protein